MDRRTFGKLLGSAALAAQEVQLAGAAMAQTTPAANDAPKTIAMLLYPKLTALDLVGPHTLFSMLPGRKVQLVWKDRETVVSDAGIPIQPTATFADVPQDVEILFVPGGSMGTAASMDDPEVMRFLTDRGARATWVTSVCTGSLVLAAAGLLRGYKATSHWNVRDLLPLLGAEPVAERVVEDRNRITAGGVTAGIDFGLTLVSRLLGDDQAKARQLVIEYDPHPPFQSGTPEEAGPKITGEVRSRLVPLHDAVRGAALRAAARQGI